jgi:DNA-binding Xre family transcriptional regulator
MAWRFRLESLLGELNQVRAQEGRRPLSWSQVAPLLGMSRQSLQNLASNREMKVTNTRFLEAMCRFFGCSVHELMEPVPEIQGSCDQAEVDRLVSPIRELSPGELPSYHVEELYGDEAANHWRELRDR